MSAGPPLKIRMIRTTETSYAVAVLRDDGIWIANGCGFDEALGVVAAAMLRPDRTPYLRRPEWKADGTNFGLTYEQYKELIA